METRIYFNQKSIAGRIKRIEENEDELNFSKYNFYGSDDNCNTVYCTLTSLLHSLPSLVKGLKVIKVSLHDVLPFEQHTHIRQGEETFGNQKTKLVVSHEDKSFFAPVTGLGTIFRAIINIWIIGTNLESVFECYRKIREGRIPTGKWKGDAVIPSHCGLLKEEEPY